MGILKDSSKVLVGITVRRILSLVMIPVIARLLGPKEYGVFNIALSVCAILSIIGGLSLEASIVVSDTKEQAASRTIGTCIIGMFSAIFFGLIALLNSSFIEKIYSSEVVNCLLIMIPFFVSITIINVSLQNYVGYIGKFFYFSLADIIATIAYYCVFVLTYLLFFKDYRALIVSEIIQLISRCIIFVYASQIWRISLKKLINLKLAEELWKARNFSKFNLPANLLNTANVQLAPILMSLVLSEGIIGFFAMARNIILIPVQLSGQALGQVFYPNAAKEYLETKRLDKITWRTFLYSCQMTLFPAIFIAAAANFILPVLLGTKWQGITPYIILLLPVILLRTVQTQIGIGFIFSILNQNNKIFIGNVLLFVCCISPLILCLSLKPSSFVTIFSYSIGSAIGYGILLAWIFVTVNINLGKAFFTWIKYCLLSGACVLPIVLSILNDNIILVSFYLTISVLLYSTIAWIKFLNQVQRNLIMSKIFPFVNCK